MHNVQIFFGDIAGDILGSSDGDMFRAAGQPDGGDARLEDPGVRGPDEDLGHHRVREQQHHQHQRAHPRHRGPHEPRHREQANRDCSLTFLFCCFISEKLLFSDLTKHWQYFGGHISTYNSFFQTAASWQKIDPELLQETKCMMFYIPGINCADGF